MVMGGWVGGWVGCDLLPLRFNSKYNNKQAVVIPNMQSKYDNGFYIKSNEHFIFQNLES